MTTQAPFLLLIFLLLPLLLPLLLTRLLLTRAWKANLARIAAGCCILACAASLSGRGQELAAGGTAAGIRALESAWTVGQSRNDSGALDLIFDSALVYVEYGKLISKGEYLSRIKRESPQQDQIVMGPMTVRTFTTTAIVVGTYSERKVEKGSFELERWRFIDTWVYKKDGWVLVAAAAVPLSKSEPGNP